MLTQDQKERYSRQLLLPELGEEGQSKLYSSKILVIGAGGLGSPILLYLSAAGIGTIGLVEFDRLDRSNLHRQILYDDDETGLLKGELAVEKIRRQNPEVKIVLHQHYLSNHNALEIIGQYDVIVDGSDNLPTRYLVNDSCRILSKPFVYGAVYRFEGQVAVFNILLPDGSRSANYRDVYPVPPDPEMVTACNTGGVLGALVGIIGSAMASETIKLITGIGSSLHNRIWLFDALDFSSRFVNVEANKAQPIPEELINYESFCDPAPGVQEGKDITPNETQSLLKKNSVILIDVRESDEFRKANIGGINIPLKEITNQAFRIPKRATVVLLCKSGSRSAIAARKLQDLGFSNLLSMRGGLNRWRAEIDPDFPAC